jgi:hypothetical protein
MFFGAAAFLQNTCNLRFDVDRETEQRLGGEVDASPTRTGCDTGVTNMTDVTCFFGPRRVSGSDLTRLTLLPSKKMERGSRYI